MASKLIREKGNTEQTVFKHYIVNQMFREGIPDNWIPLTIYNMCGYEFTELTVLWFSWS